MGVCKTWGVVRRGGCKTWGVVRLGVARRGGHKTWGLETDGRYSQPNKFNARVR